MIAWEPRSAWTTRVVDPPHQTAVRAGTAVHWTGSDLDIADHESCLRHVRAVEEYHVGVKRMSAIAYNEAVCRHGYRIEGRGRGMQSGANGSLEANRMYGSTVALVGLGETLTAAEWDLIHAGLLESAKLQAPGMPLLTHNQVRPDPTACPGPDLTAWVEAGCPPPPVPVEDDMPLTPEDIKRIWTSPVGGQAGQPGWWQQLNKRLDEVLTRLDDIVARVDRLEQK